MKFFRQALYFLIGALLLVILSVMQKLLAEYSVKLEGFVIPLLWGGIVGSILGNMYTQIKMQRNHLRESNAQLTQSLDDTKEMYNDLQVAKHKASESERLKTSFLSNLSHEIRTPMNGIIGFVQMLSTDFSCSEKERALYIDNITLSTERLLDVVDNIVDISRIESGSVELYRVKTNVNDLLKKACDIYTERAKGKGLEIDVTEKLDSSHALIFSDRTKLVKVMKHLVSNAIKFTFKGKIELGVRIKDAYIEFFVTDTGVGIDSSMQANIFNRFSKDSENENPEFQGTGLGLSISKAYVELLGGMIEFESEKGKGSHFSFIIPYDQASS